VITAKLVSTGERLYENSVMPIRIGSNPSCEIVLPGSKDGDAIFASLTWKDGVLFVERGSSDVEINIGHPETGMEPVTDGSIAYPNDQLQMGHEFIQLSFDAYEPRRFPTVSVSLVAPREEVLYCGIQVELGIGSSSECPVRLDGVAGIELEHAILRWQNGNLWLCDLGSESGTWVGEVAVSGSPSPVNSGSLIRLGTNGVIRVTYDWGETRVVSSFDFLFVYDSSTRTFPVRFWITPDQNSESLPDIVALDGRVTETDWQRAHGELKKRFPQNRYIITRMSATSWTFVEDNFHGMYFHTD